MENMNHENGTNPYLRWAFWGFVGIAAFFLLTEHSAHVFGILPWLLILACPLMHVFGHHGHHGHGGHGGHQQDQGSADQSAAEDKQADEGARDKPAASHHHH